MQEKGEIFFSLSAPEIYGFVILQLGQETALTKFFLDGVQDLFTFGVYGVVVVAGGYVFQKAGLAGADFFHVGADITANINPHVCLEDAIDLVIDKHITDLSRLHLQWRSALPPPDRLCDTP